METEFREHKESIFWRFTENFRKFRTSNPKHLNIESSSMNLNILGPFRPALIGMYVKVYELRKTIDFYGEWIVFETLSFQKHTRSPTSIGGMAWMRAAIVSAVIWLRIVSRNCSSLFFNAISLLARTTFANVRSYYLSSSSYVYAYVRFNFTYFCKSSQEKVSFYYYGEQMENN